jgi:hypothetical protein
MKKNHFYFWNSAKAGMYMKANDLLVESRNVYENKPVIAGMNWITTFLGNDQESPVGAEEYSRSTNF